MKTSHRGRALIERFEGRRLTSYRCSSGVWTVGVGHTGPDVRPGLTITEAECDRLFNLDLGEVEAAVAQCVKVPLSQNQFDALVSLGFNIGCPALKASTLVKVVNAMRFEAAADQFPRWCHSGGQVSKGLIRRRNEERDLFTEP